MANHEAAVKRAHGSESQIPETVAQSQAVRTAETIARCSVYDDEDGRESTREDVAIVVAHCRNKLTTAAYVLECVERGETVDEEVQGLARGAMRDVRDLCRVLDALSGGRGLASECARNHEF